MRIDGSGNGWTTFEANVNQTEWEDIKGVAGVFRFIMAIVMVVGSHHQTLSQNEYLSK